ncbi:signal peptide peptidase SppA [Desulfovibrionales bacterium]
MALFRYIGIFFSLIWQALNWMRRMIANVIFLVFIAIIAAVMLSERTPPVSPRSVLELHPAGRLVEETTPVHPLDTLMGQMDTGSLPSETKVQDLIDAVFAASTDPNIIALRIDASDMLGCDTTKLVDLGAAIRTFTYSGKPVFAHGPAFTQGQYLLASYADQVALSPLGGVALTGFGLFQTYFKGLLDKAEVRFHIFRVGTHKTAVEPFTRQDMSPEAKEDALAWSTQFWQIYTREIAANRGIAAETVTDYVQHIDQHLAQVQGNAALLAQRKGLVDAVQTSQQFDEALAEKLGLSRDDLTFVSSQDYVRTLPAKTDPGPCVAIVRGRGTIVPGKRDESMIGSESMRERLRQAQDDPSIKAVVLRLDSPGGSATASEDIALEVEALRAAGKPVVVSMGSVAASGAYWIAAAADRIVAAPSTLTGSIGIFAALPTFENTAKAWGITTDGIATSPLAGLGNPLLPLPPVAQASLQQVLEFGYAAFLDRVMRGRGLSQDQAEASAQGKVFTGQDALDRKLIDHLGDINQAVRVAGELAGLENPRTKELRRQLSPRENLFQELAKTQARIFGHTALHLISQALESRTELLTTFTDPNHLYARSLECEAVEGL